EMRGGGAPSLPLAHGDADAAVAVPAGLGQAMAIPGRWARYCVPITAVNAPSVEVLPFTLLSRYENSALAPIANSPAALSVMNERLTSRDALVPAVTRPQPLFATVVLS